MSEVKLAREEWKDSKQSYETTVSEYKSQKAKLLDKVLPGLLAEFKKLEDDTKDELWNSYTASQVREYIRAYIEALKQPDAQPALVQPSYSDFSASLAPGEDFEVQGGLHAYSAPTGVSLTFTLRAKDYYKTAYAEFVTRRLLFSALSELGLSKRGARDNTIRFLEEQSPGSVHIATVAYHLAGAWLAS